MAATNKIETHGLLHAAKQLRNDRLVRIFETFLEYHTCIWRTIIQLIIVAWSGIWLFGPQPVLVKDAQAVFPTSVALLIATAIWMVLVRRRIIPASHWLDAAGFTISLLLIGIQTYLAFMLLISLNAFLPFIVISAVARYGQRMIKPALTTAFILLFLTAPAGYWLSRPAYFVYAIALSIALPWLVARMFMAMQEIAHLALVSRDAQSRFISTMSHELRTPLNAIINFSQLIDAEILPMEQRELMKAVVVNATALRHRVNEILDVASIDGSRLHLRGNPLNMLDVMHTVDAICTNAASIKGVTFTIRFESPKTLCIIGDEGRIEQVITNLVTNAIKFTPAGGTADLLIAAVPIESRWNITVTVTDTGIGVPNDEKETIFMPFTQLSSGASRIGGGVGLGLFIAFSISNEMNGTLTVSDNPGGGSIFCWQFTAAATSIEKRRSFDLREALEEHAETVLPQHCLVFEDMDTNHLVIDNLLVRAGHRVTFHADGNDAAKRIRAAAPDIVFLDLHMPGKSGWDVLRDVADTITTMPPIIVLTADTRADLIPEAMANGATGYLSKPINGYELLEVIKHHAANRRRQ